ncbi:PAS domain-containing protein [Rhizobium sp. GN54]|uniref:PAS domain-containing protein n=1 Tax=Rhizobium sp. GN54 TaxID=2898150 RepID=UPI001E470506|nr:PAS domain-containing protein [Rhizobium sp. GN54]MCD2182648.1 PAS domain-containing protein [Rhizobium sp. GN54]
MTNAPILSEPVGAEAAARLVERVVGNGWATDPAGNFIYVTPAILSALGLTLYELNSVPEQGHFGWRSVIHPADYDDIASIWRRCLQTGEHYDVEHRMLRASGAFGWSRSSGQPLRDADGRITGWYGTVIDADVQSVLLNRLPAVADPDREKAALDAPRPLGLIHPDDRTAAAHAAARAFWTGVPQVIRHRQRQPDGDYRWIETRSEPGYSVSVDIDDLVTDKDPPAAARLPVAGTSEAIGAARVVESIFGNGWAFDAEGRWIYLHPFAQNSLGVTLEYLNAALDEGHTAWKRLLHPDDYDRIAATWHHCLATGDHFNVEFRFRRASGAYVWARTAARPARDGQGHIVGWFGIALDIDVYKKTVAALRDRERAFSQLVDMVPSHLWQLTPDGEPVFFNRRMVDFLGMDAADMVQPGKSGLATMIETSVHPEDAAPFGDALRHCFRTGERFSMRYRLRRSDGVYRWMSSGAEPLLDADGRVLQWYGLCHDIDDQVKAEEALRSRELELQQLIDTVPVQIWCVTPDGDPAYINKTMVDYTGMALDDFDAEGGLPSAIQTIVHPDDRDSLHSALGHSFTTGEPFDLKFRNRRSDGAYRWTEGRAEPLRDETGRIIRWYGANVDIQDSIDTQEALRTSKRQLEQMIDAVPVNILSFDPSGKITYTSRRYLESVGSPLAHVEDFDALALDLAHPDDFPTMHRRASEGFATGQPFVNRFRRRDRQGAYRWIEARAQPLRDENGTIVQWYIASIDLEDEMRAQQALRDRERRLRQLVETLPAMIDCAAPDGEPVYRSRQLREFLGYDLEVLDGTGKSRLGGTLDAGVHPDDLDAVKQSYAHSLSTGEPYARRHRLRRFDGEYRWVETRAAPMRNGEGTIVQWNVICLDIDGEVRAREALRLAQDRLSRASQAASLAELSASIAHEVNQPLAAIVANSYACHRWLSAEPPNLERAKITAERIIRDANAAADVVSRIRALFRQSAGSRSTAAIGNVIAEARDLMAEEAMRRRVRIEFEAQAGLPMLALDRTQIQQVLVNLIRNGMEAMEGVAAERVLGLYAGRADEGIRIEVSDRGPGLDDPDKVFEPFFTTKQEGMGMGLAICRSIIESHGGRLWAEKNEPQGARFIFVLPVDTKAHHDEE